jgi:hypothetical protein
MNMKHMKHGLLALALAAAMGPAIITRSRTRDVAFPYRMGAGFPGDVNRTHPASILPGLMDSTDPIRLYGDPCLIDATDNTYRGFTTADTGDTQLIAGLLVRPYPIQQQSGGMSASIGAATPPTSGAIDILDDGFMIAKCNNFAANPPRKGADVWVWVVASTGNHVLGGMEAAEDSTPANTSKVLNARWNSPPDANGIAEIQVWPANA